MKATIYIYVYIVIMIKKYTLDIYLIHGILTATMEVSGVHTKHLKATILFADFTKAFDSIHCGKMEQIQLAHVLPKETVSAIIMLYKNMKVKVRFPDGDADYYDIVAGMLGGDLLATSLFLHLPRLPVKNVN